MKRWLNICSVHFRMQIFGTEGDDYSPGLALWWSDLAVLGGLMIGYICTSFSPSSECMFESSFTAVTIIFLSLWLSLFISLLREVLEVHEFRGVWKRVVMTGRKAEVVESRVWSLSPPPFLGSTHCLLSFVESAERFDGSFWGFHLPTCWAQADLPFNEESCCSRT